MSKADTAAAASPRAAPSPQYLDWLRQERRTRLAIRLAQIALLVPCYPVTTVFLHRGKAAHIEAGAKRPPLAR